MQKDKNYQKREGLFEEVYEIVREIPAGKVMTYGQIARRLGTRDPRKVGWALHCGSKTLCNLRAIGGRPTTTGQTLACTLAASTLR